MYAAKLFLTISQFFPRRKENKIRWVVLSERDVDKRCVRKNGEKEVVERMGINSSGFYPNPMLYQTKLCKIRWLFNAAALFFLHDVLVVSPHFPPELFGTHVSFRLFFVVLTAVVEAIFLRFIFPLNQKCFYGFVEKVLINDLRDFQYTWPRSVAQ